MAPTGKFRNSLSYHNSGCTQDKVIIFGSMIWFSGATNLTTSYKIYPRMTLVAMATKFETKSAYKINSAVKVKEISSRSLKTAEI